MPRSRPSLPPLSIPNDDPVEVWLDHFDSPESIEEQPEYTINLGAETPASGVSFDDSVPTPPPRMFRRSSSNLTRKLPKKRRETVDRDCGICFEYAVHPSRVLCCGTIFCSEHITDWLCGPSSDGCCPSCSAPCSMDNILSLSAPSLIPRSPSVPTELSSRVFDKTSAAPPFDTPSRHRSQSASTAQTTSSTSTADSPDSSVLGLSLAPEQSPYEVGGGVEQATRRWFFAHSNTHTHLSRLPPLRRLHSSSSLVDSLGQPTSPNPLQQYTSPYPFINPGSSTVEVISRLASVMGLTLLFYVLLAS